MKYLKKVLENPLIIDMETIDEALKELKDIEHRLTFLDALESAGVDNWAGIEYAYEILHEDFPEYFEE